MLEILPARLGRHLEATRLLTDATRLLVACSGGGDSTALLLLLRDWASPRKLPVVAAHVAHGLRGAAGERDASFVAALTASLGVPFALRPVEVSRLRRKGESLEAAARRLRYEALLALARALGPGTLVATGHTRDDQAETVILNLERRLGRLRGGIRARRADGVVRPLLPFGREELRAFLLERGVAWREDETNADESFARNRVRRTILPALEAAAPGTAARLARAGEAWSRRLDALDQRIDAALAALAAPPEGPFPRSLFRSLGAEEAARLLVRAASGAGRVPGRDQVKRAALRLRGPGVRIADTLAGLRLVADARAVRLLPARPA
jgi:tRNA(Ile)-lysidine synthase